MTPRFSSRVLSYLFLSYSFSLTHSLYFSFLISFSPYILKFLSFLSPLFIPTILLLVSLFSTLLNNVNSNSALELLELGSAEEEPDDNKRPCHESHVSDQLLITSESLAEITRVVESETLQLIALKENDEKKEKEVKAPIVESNKGGEPSMSSKFVESCQPLGSNTLGNFGSTRKDKEWKGTLACMLFEERHSVNVDWGSEGMDLLWETFETNSNNGKKAYHDEEDDDHGQLCCLPALKFSAPKMNLGMRRPKLVKILKALKGFGCLHHVSKHGSKKLNPLNSN